MSENDFKVFLAGLRNGLGFTKSCLLLRMNPKDISDDLSKNPVQLIQSQEAVIYAAKALLVNGSQLLQDMDLKAWEANMARIQSFISSINLWEQFCKKKEVTPQKVILAYMAVRDWDEVATMIGYTRDELNLFLLQKSGIASYINDHPHFFK